MYPISFTRKYRMYYVESILIHELIGMECKDKSTKRRDLIESLPLLVHFDTYIE